MTGVVCPRCVAPARAWRYVLHFSKSLCLLFVVSILVGCVGSIDQSGSDEPDQGTTSSLQPLSKRAHPRPPGWHCKWCLDAGAAGSDASEPPQADAGSGQ